MPDLLSARWPRLPRGRALLRWTAVAVLLALAAGVLLAGVATPPACPPIASGPAAGASASGSGAPEPAASEPGSADSAAVPSLGVPAGAVGVLVRLADPAAAAVLRPGSRVDLLPRSEGAALRDIMVLAVVAGGLFDEPGAAALLVAVPAEQVPAEQVPAEHVPTDHVPTGQRPAGPEATRVTYEVIVRIG